MTEQFAFEQIAWNGGAIDRNEGLVPARRIVMNRFRDQLLSRAALAEDQNGRHGVDHLADRFVDDLHARASADDVDAWLEALFHFFLELAKITTQLAAVHGALDEHQDFIEIERFGDVIEGAVFHRTDGVAHGILRRHQDHRGVDAVFLELFEQFQTIDVRKLDVHQRNVEMAVGNKPTCGRAVGRDLHPIALGLERFLQNEAQRFFIFGNENFSLIHFNLSPPPPKRP